MWQTVEIIELYVGTRGAANSIVIAGAVKHGKGGNQLSSSTDLSYDRRDNVLYVLDSGNRRVQRFSMDGLIDH